MTFLQLILSATCVIGISAGQVLFKIAAISIDKPKDFTGILYCLINPYLAAALLLYCSLTLLWVWTLRITPLQIAYPIQGLAFLIIPILNYFVMGESITSRTILGGLIILIGIYTSVR